MSGNEPDVEEEGVAVESGRTWLALAEPRGLGGTGPAAAAPRRDFPPPATTFSRLSQRRGTH